MPLFNFSGLRMQKVLTGEWQATHIVDLLTRSREIIFSNPHDLLVLFDGIRRKHEILEIFLYYLFLVRTGIWKETKTHRYEQNSIAGSGMSGHNDGNFCLVISLPLKKLSISLLFIERVSPLGVPIRPAWHTRFMLSGCCAGWQERKEDSWWNDWYGGCCRWWCSRWLRHILYCRPWLVAMLLGQAVRQYIS